MPPVAGPADICDWDSICRGIADLAPLWQPGTVSCYHAFTYGWILGEVARRVDGRSFGQIVQEEICAPVGITALHLGIPDAVEARVAPLEATQTAAPPEPPPSADPLSPETLWPRIVPPSLLPLHEVFNRPDVRRACIPAAGGVMNARAIARHYAALASGVLDGVRLLSPARIVEASTVQASDPGLGESQPWYRALGYFRFGDPVSPSGGRRTLFGHGGAGGSLGFADLMHHFAFGLTKNRMVESPPGEGTADRVLQEMLSALGLPGVS
jgi:CubicO group peptidase (beta-lactamase class C family)